MHVTYPVYWPQFFTATIINWRPLLANNAYKDIVIESLQFLVTGNRIELNAFVIMSNHIHLIWQPLNQFSPEDVQLSFMKYTAQQILRKLKSEAPETAAAFKVNKHDR